MADYELIEAAGIEVRISNPRKVFFPELGITKLDLVNYYLELAEPVVNHLRDRPTVLKRFVDGAGSQAVLPEADPRFGTGMASDHDGPVSQRALGPRAAAQRRRPPRLGRQPGRDRLEPVAGPRPRPRSPRRAASRPRPNPRGELGRRPPGRARGRRGAARPRPDRLSRRPAARAGSTSTSRLVPEHDFVTVRRAAVALAREVERRAPEIATSKWWKEERHGVFIDYNQNLRDRTIASAYSVRPTPDARVSTPLTLGRGARRRARRAADRHGARRWWPSAATRAADIDAHAGSLDGLLALAQRDEEAGLGDAPWPPHFKKQEGEPKRVQPSRARKDSGLTSSASARAGTRAAACPRASAGSWCRGGSVRRSRGRR